MLDAAAEYKSIPLAQYLIARVTVDFNPTPWDSLTRKIPAGDFIHSRKG
jgi:hypothetical protein